MRIWLALVSCLAVAAACGERSDLSPGNRAAGDAGAKLDAAGGVDAAGNQDAGTDSGGGDDSGPNTDGGGDGAPNADSGGPDSGPGDPGITCGQSYCQVGTQVCCVSTQGDSCQALGQPCTQNDTAVRCDDTADCPNSGVCCGTLQNQHYTVVQCVAQCQDVQFCDPAVNDCPQGTQCRQSQILQGFHVCR